VDTVVLTASAGAFPGLAEALRELPVAIHERPLLSFAPPESWSELDAALMHRDRFTVLALTSPRAARAVIERLTVRQLRWKDGAGPAVWVVGSATSSALEGRLGSVQRPAEDLQEDESAASTLARAILSSGLGGPVLFPCGDRRRDELPEMLRARGIEVHETVCYRTVLAGPAEARAAVNGCALAVVASPSVLELLAGACPPSGRPKLVVVGATTAAAARARGWEPAAVARQPSTRALASAVAGLLATR
jgi:uroporphyrinogen-III synthase